MTTCCTATWKSAVLTFISSSCLSVPCWTFSLWGQPTDLLFLNCFQIHSLYSCSSHYFYKAKLLYSFMSILFKIIDLCLFSETLIYNSIPSWFFCQDFLEVPHCCCILILLLVPQSKFWHYMLVSYNIYRLPIFTVLCQYFVQLFKIFSCSQLMLVLYWKLSCVEYLDTMYCWKLFWAHTCPKN